MTKDKYTVGQVLFLSLTDKTVLLPIRITEKIVRETMSGSEISYLVEIPGKEGSYDLSKINGDLFASIEASRAFLLEKYTALIDEVAADAKSVAVSSFGYTHDDSNLEQSLFSEKKSKPKQKPKKAADSIPSSTRVTLPDGTVANLKK